MTGKRRLQTLTTALEALSASTRRNVAQDLVADITRLGEQIRQLEQQLAELVTPIAPALLAIVGVNVVTAAKLIGEAAGITRFRSAAAFAMHTGTAPIPVWSGGRPHYRLNRGGNRQLNACLHRITLTQLAHHPPTRDHRNRWVKDHPHATSKAALRTLKRHLNDRVYHAMTTDHHTHKDQHTPTT